MIGPIFSRSALVRIPISFRCFSVLSPMFCSFWSSPIFLETKVVPRGGIEPPTRGFSILCSTTELPRHVCAGLSLRIFGFSAMKKYLALSGKSFYTPLAFDLISNG